jgi:hypothetical protein
MSEQNVLPKVTIYQQYAGYADIAKGYAPTDDVADAVDDEVVHPVTKFFEAAPINDALAKADKRVSVAFDWGIPPADDVDDDGEFYKAPAIVRHNGPMTLQKRLGIIRSEKITTAAGDVWLHGFDANNQLVDARLLRCAAD